MNDFELDSMRQQMETLKKKLEKQEIVNDRIIRQSMKKTASSISRRYWILIAVAVLMVPYGYWAFVMLAGFSVAFWIATSVFMLVCAGATFYNSQYRKQLQHHGGTTCWKYAATWHAPRSSRTSGSSSASPAVSSGSDGSSMRSISKAATRALQGLIYAGIVGGIIGAIIGFRMHFKTQRQYQEILDQIEDLEDAR